MNKVIHYSELKTRIELELSIYRDINEQIDFSDCSNDELEYVGSLIERLEQLQRWEQIDAAFGEKRRRAGII